MSLTTRLIVWSLVLTGATYVTTIGLSNREGRRAAIAAAEREATNGTDAAALAIDETLQTTEESTAALARALSELQPAPEAAGRLVQRFAAENRQTVAQYTVLSADDATAPRSLRDTLERGVAGWTEPYRDTSIDNATVITFVVPIEDRGGRLGRAAAASLRLDFLSTVLRNVHFGASGSALVLTGRGRLVAHSRRDLSGTIHDPLEEMAPALRAVVEPVARRAQAGESGFAAVPVDGRTFRLTFRPVPRTGWSIATAYAEDELLATVSSLQRTQIALAVAGLATLAIAIVILSRRITRPLGALASSAARLGTGDLDGPLPESSSHDEIGKLTVAFRNMRDSLKHHIRTLQEATVARERLEGEMRAARRIQTDMLRAPSAGGASAGYNLSAVLVPARAVGGDLFDYFEQHRQVFFLVGDVSGKGIAAALFMARAKTLFDAVALIERDPGVVLATLNRSLCQQNDSGMYVTAVCGVLDVTTGAVRLATAGHEPPVFVRHDGRSHLVASEGGRVLGLIDLGDYPVHELALAPGDALVLFTDGVSEAQNADGGFFGTERLLEATGGPIAPTSASDITTRLLQAVQSFAGGAPQSDDITILTLALPPR